MLIGERNLSLHCLSLHQESTSSVKKKLKVTLWILISLGGLFLLIGGGLFIGLLFWSGSESRLPSEQYVRQQFQEHKADYIQFARLLKNDPSSRFIDGDGKVDIDGVHEHLVPQYRDLVRKLGVKSVIVREDRSIEFELGGHGGTIESDSYIGIRYFPDDHGTNSNGGYDQILVHSLDSAALPQENGSVATGLYVVPIEPEWFVYRFEYQE
jgi:hypothetical protein